LQTVTSCWGETVATFRAVKRLGRAGDDPTTGTSGSPDIVELDDGDFAVIGWDVTGQVDLSTLPGVHCAAGERTVRLDREVLLRARRDIPDE
jgi:hypothetical protein